MTSLIDRLVARSRAPRPGFSARGPSAWTIAVALSLAAAGCGDEGTAPSQAAGAVPPGPAPAASSRASPLDLSGRWESACRDASDSDSARAAFAYDGSQGELRYEFYGSPGCQAPGDQLTVRGPLRTRRVEAGGSVGTYDVWMMDVRSVQVTPVGEKAAAELNSERFCGIADWRAGEPRETRGLDCSGELGQPVALSAAFKIEGDKLWLDEVAASERPIDDASFNPTFVPSFSGEPLLRKP